MVPHGPQRRDADADGHLAERGDVSLLGDRVFDDPENFFLAAGERRGIHAF
jgi:hypothetical protein